MPTATEYTANHDPLRVLVYGPPKSRKTWWALRAAEAGFRVFVFNIEGNLGIVKQIPEAVRKNIHIFSIPDGAANAYASVALTTVLREHVFYANEEKRLISNRPNANLSIYDMREWGKETVVVIDTYTALVASVVRNYAFANNIDLADASKPEWEGYRWCGGVLTWMLTQLQALATHTNVVVIAHATQYEKHKKDKINPNKQGPIEFTRRQPVSSSGPHGMSLAGKFSDVLYFYTRGKSSYIDSFGDEFADGGSVNMPPDTYKWEDLTFGALANAAEIVAPAKLEPFVFPPCQQTAPLKNTGTDGKPTIQPSANSQSSLLGTKRSTLLKK